MQRATHSYVRSFPRFFCHDCRKSFTDRPPDEVGTARYEPSIVYHAADLYFDTEGSFRGVARQFRVRPYTVFEWIDELGKNCKSFVEVARELQPRWGGWLLADGKAVFIKGVEHALLLAADHTTQDIPVALLAKSENFEDWKRLFLLLRDEIGYIPKGITMDGDPGLFKAARHVFPRTPLQWCVWHAGQYWDYHFKYVYKGHSRGVQPFLQDLEGLCQSETLAQAQYRSRKFHARAEQYVRWGLESAYVRLTRRLRHLFAHLHHPGMPQDSNVIEGIIRQLSRKIHDTDGYQTFDTAWRSLQLLILRYRFHRFSCSRTPEHNGKAPLELAGVNIDGLHWARYSQKAKPEET